MPTPPELFLAALTAISLLALAEMYQQSGKPRAPDVYLDADVDHE